MTDTLSRAPMDVLPVSLTDLWARALQQHEASLPGRESNSLPGREWTQRLDDRLQQDVPSPKRPRLKSAGGCELPEADSSAAVEPLRPRAATTAATSRLAAQPRPRLPSPSTWRHQSPRLFHN